MFGTISRDILVEVHDLKYSRPIWEPLQNRFISASIARSMELKYTLTTIQKYENQFMDQYLHDIKLIADSLVAINSRVPLHDLIEYTILGLGGFSDYDSLITTLTHFSWPIDF